MRWSLLESLREKVAQAMDDNWWVGIWDGGEDAFNIEERWPAVYVAYEGCSFEEQPEIGATTYTREFHFWVLVCSRDVKQALDALGVLERELTGAVLAQDVSQLVPYGNEELIAAELGHYLYAQSYVCTELKTK